MSNALKMIEAFKARVAAGESQEAIKDAFTALRAAEITADGRRNFDPEAGATGNAVMIAVTEHIALCLDRLATAAENIDRNTRPRAGGAGGWYDRDAGVGGSGPASWPAVGGGGGDGR